MKISKSLECFCSKRMEISMFKEKLQSLILKNESKDNKKKIENIVVLIVIVIIVIIAINYIWNDEKKQTSKNEVEQNFGKQLATTNESKEKEDLEEKLENILSKIEGVGNVKVVITYSESSEVIAMYNEDNKDSTIEETDSGGGKRITKENDTKKQVIFEEENGSKVPMTQKVITPKIEGAVVTAVGANNALIKNNIIQAVEALTGIATHKIQVFEMNKN